MKLWNWIECVQTHFVCKYQSGAKQTSVIPALLPLALLMAVSTLGKPTVKRG